MDPNKVREKRKYNQEMMDKDRDEIKNLYGMIHALEKRNRKQVIKKHHYAAMKKILAGGKWTNVRVLAQDHQ